MNAYAIRGRIIDAVSPSPIEDGLVVIEGTRLSYVGSYDPAKIPDQAQVLSVPDGTILPGFIDCHAHLTGHQDAGSFCGGKLFGDQLLGGAYQCGLLLDAGFTGIRDMSRAGCFLSRAVERGVLRGPKIMPGGRVLGITSGHSDFDVSKSKEEFNRDDSTTYLIDGPEDCLRGVREQFRTGAKFIKICATGGVSSPTDRVDDVAFSDEELRVIVEEAKRHHTYVCAHCTGYEGAYAALKAGVSCIEHGVMLTQREIDLMAKMDATLVTTLAVSLGVANIPGLPDWMARKARDCAEANKETIRMAREAGIRIAFGSDYSNSRNSPYLELGSEFVAMTRAGMTPMEAIRAGTINAAHLMLAGHETGSLEAGKLADVVLVDGNPLEDIRVLAHADHVKAVFLNGKLEKNLC
ncbi:MAG: amidohydrolase family protein [Clostridia bacterium]|nr:amidohydrolase family protein [Clostridia bacterium]